MIYQTVIRVCVCVRAWVCVCVRVCVCNDIYTRIYYIH